MNFDLRNFALWVVIVLLLLGLFTLFQNPGQRSNSPDISFSQLLNEVDSGRVRDLLIAGQEIRGTFTDGRSFQSVGPNDHNWIERAQRKGVSLTLRSATNEFPAWVSLLVSWLPFLALIGVWIFLSRRMQAGGGLAALGGTPTASRAEIDGLKRQLADMQAEIDRLREKIK